MHGQIAHPAPAPSSCPPQQVLWRAAKQHTMQRQAAKAAAAAALAEMGQSVDEEEGNKLGASTSSNMGQAGAAQLSEAPASRNQARSAWMSSSRVRWDASGRAVECVDERSGADALLDWMWMAEWSRALSECGGMPVQQRVGLDSAHSCFC